MNRPASVLEHRSVASRSAFAPVALALGRMGYEASEQPVDLGELGLDPLHAAESAWLLAEHDGIRVVGVELRSGADWEAAGYAWAALQEKTVWLLASDEGKLAAALEYKGNRAAWIVQDWPAAQLDPAWLEALNLVDETGEHRHPARMFRAALRHLKERELRALLLSECSKQEVLSDEAYLERLLCQDPRPDSDADHILQQLAAYPLRDPSVHRRAQRDVPHEVKDEWLRQRSEVARIRLRLVLWIAHKYTDACRTLEFMDLFQAGVLGLIRATETFDPTRATFSTYAYLWIRQRIDRTIQNEDHLIRKPTNARGKRAEEDPAWRDVESLSSVDAARIERALPDPEAPQCPHARVEAKEQRIRVLQAIRSLKWREQVIIVHRYGFLHGSSPETLQEIATRLGMTRARAHQIQHEAENRLRILLASDSGSFGIGVT